MLVIRLSRIGKRNQPAYRVVLQDKRNAVKGMNLEVLGFYNVAERKHVNLVKGRIEHWIKMGAIPSDSVAVLLKNNGFTGMESYIGPRNFKRKKKNGEEEVAAAPAPAAAPVAAPEVEAAAPVEEAAPAEEVKAEEPAPVAEEVAVADEEPSVEEVAAATEEPAAETAEEPAGEEPAPPAA